MLYSQDTSKDPWPQIAKGLRVNVSKTSLRHVSRKI